MKKTIIICIVAVLAIILINTAYFTVDETHQVVISRFGEIVKVVVPEETYETVKAELAADSRFDGIKVEQGRGLFFKVPFIDTVQYFSTQLYTYDASAREVITYDKKSVTIDNSAQWHITNPVLFKVSIGSVNNAQSRIDDLLYSKMNEKVGKITAATLISDRETSEEMLMQIADENNSTLNQYGMNITFVRIKKADYPEENYDNIYDRMIAERNQMATLYRSEGQEEALKIKSDADKQAAVITAEAEKQAAITRGQADADAAKIYNEAYAVDREFYEFYRTLLAYKESLTDADTTIIIDKDSPFAQYLYGVD
ncbi:MAG: protease modulator HflC [Clostridia bacterium]|nr:protease modulator HflC [Clostridia bacterium]